MRGCLLWIKGCVPDVGLLSGLLSGLVGLLSAGHLSAA